MGKYVFTVNMDSDTTHAKLIRMVGQGKKVLEVGCSTGYMSKVFKEQFGCEVTGFEKDPDDASQAEEFCTKVIAGDIESLNLKDCFGEKQFDVITFGDVLEHLVDPFATLKNIKSFLKPDGYIVASFPNISYIGIILSLLHGEFNYMPLGILDNTHLRFFTKKSIYEMFWNAGFKIELCENIIVEPDKSEFSHITSKFPIGLLKALKHSEELLVYQYVVKAVPMGVDVPPEYEPITGKTALDDIIGIIDAIAVYSRSSTALSKHPRNGKFSFIKTKLKLLERLFRKTC